MLRSSQRGLLSAFVAGLVVLIVVLQARIDPLRRQPAIEPQNLKRAVSTQVGPSALPFEYTLGAVSGFRQVIAGLLWVRADSFFHQGNYDAILPLVRIITWMDPNFLDVYSTGAWHMMYNFTDEFQRSDRRYLPAGLALLEEGIRNNPNLWDLYADAGWTYYDKVKDFDESVSHYQAGLLAKNPDNHRIGHGLAHALEHMGRIDAAIAAWEAARQRHQKLLDDPKESADRKGRARMGIQTATRNLNMIRVRKISRPDDTKPPVDAQFSVRVVRLRPKVLEVSGRWNLVGAKNFDPKGSKVDVYGFTGPIWGPVDGARVDVRLTDYGYVRPPTPREFSFNVDPSVTILQDQLSVRGGRAIAAGDLYVAGTGDFVSLNPTADRVGVYGLTKKEQTPGMGVTVGEALAGKAALSALGRRQLAAVRDTLKSVGELDKAGYRVALRPYRALGKYGPRELDMSKDPKMYSFSKDRYDLVLSFNPRTAPEFVQDRLGWSGEGLADKRYLVVDAAKGNLRMIRVPITLTREDILGTGRKVLYTTPGTVALAR